MKKPTRCWKTDLWMILFWVLLAVTALALFTGCALIPSNESKTANAKTAGNMEQEHEKTIRAFAASVGTNGGSLYINGRTHTRTTDSEKFEYSYVRSLPFLITVGVGLLLCGGGGFAILTLHKSVKKSSAAYAAVTDAADIGLSRIAGQIQSFCATEKDDRVVTLLKTIGGEVSDARGKVNSI